LEGKHYSLKTKGKNRYAASELDVCSFRRTKKEEVEEMNAIFKYRFMPTSTISNEILFEE